MGLSGTGTALGDKIAAIITASDAPADMKASIKTMWEEIGTVVVDHIVENAKVGAGIPVSTAGSASAQTGQTTGQGSIV
jgi:hypothetical protein